MARLDAFIDLLVREGADSLVLETGAGATLLRAGAAPRALLKQTLTASQIAGALGEVLPEQARGKAPKAGTAFSYASPAGLMHVSCEQGTSGIRVVVTPELADAVLDDEEESPFGAAGHIGFDDDASIELESEDRTPPRGTAPISVPRAEEHAAGSLEALIAAARELGASDIHLVTGAAPAVRIDGALRSLEGWAATDADHLLWPLLPPPMRDELAKSRAAVGVLQTAAGRVRANVFAEARGTGASLRVVMPAVPATSELGLGPAVIEQLQQAAGLVVVAGAAGSGRTTTLASLVEAACELRSDQIVVLQESLEFLHGGGTSIVRQRELGTHVATLADGLRQAMRGDANVIAIDELRDADSIQLALEAASRGHLVIATLAAPTAQAAVERLARQNAAALADTLRCALAQSLCARVDGGRVAAVEVLLGAPAVSAAIRDGKTFQLPSVQQAARAQGMATLNDALLELVRKHFIEPREAWQRSPARTELRPALERAGFALQ